MEPTLRDQIVECNPMSEIPRGIVVPIADYNSELTYDFHLPMTERAVLAYSPDLRLLFNRRYDLFQVHRVRKIWDTYDIDGSSYTFSGYDLVWEIDWLEGLDAGDDPLPLIKYMLDHDRLDHPELETDSYLLDKLEEQEARYKNHAQENFRHAFADNSALLQKAYEPLHNPSPGLTR